MQTTFSAEVRVLICLNCGAPLEANIAGGSTTCRFCNTVNQLTRRNDQALFQPMAHARLPEPERLRLLRAQDGRLLLPPESLKSLFPNGQLPSWKVPEAMAVWQAVRQELEQTGAADFGGAERLLFLTVILGNHFAAQNDALRQRAMFESALEAFSVPRHQQIMRGYLCRSAVRTGDLAAAEEWLAPCDPYSQDLEMDSAYRASRAFIDTAKGDYNAVLRVLGGQKDEVPILDALDPLCTVLRANAWERLGNLEAALAALHAGMADRATMENVVKANPSLQLCEQSFATALRRYDVVAGHVAAKVHGEGIGQALFVIGLVVTIPALASMLIAVPLFFLFDIGSGTIDIDRSIFSGMPSGFSDIFSGMLSGMLFMFGFSAALTGLPFLCIGYFMKKGAQRAGKIRTHGVLGTARVMSSAPTGLTGNSGPHMRYELLVTLSSSPPYTVFLNTPGPNAKLVQGAEVRVRVDPQNPSEAVLEE